MKLSAARILSVLLSVFCAAFIGWSALAQDEPETDDGGGGGQGGQGGVAPPRGSQPPTFPRRVTSRYAESIISFDSRVAVQKDGSVLVTETIRVFAMGRQIKRGIFRDLPTRYRDRLGNRVHIKLTVLGVLRDGKAENWFTESRSNGVRIYAGRKNYRLPTRREYAYTIRYRMNRMVGFFDGYDEIYWNATSNGWAFPIEFARATIILPPGARVSQSIAYTGAQGAKGTAYRKTTNAQGHTVFETTAPLRRYHGMTVAVGFNKGVITAPSQRTKAIWFFEDNMSTALGLFGLIVLLIYYLTAWWHVGKDPRKGAIIPLYEPPEGISPAAARFIQKMGFDNKAFAAAVVNMAVKGFVSISEDKKKKFTLKKNGDGQNLLTAGERSIAGKLFKSSASVKLENKNHAKISGSISALKKYLKGEFETTYFLTNWKYWLIGLLLTVATLILAVLGADDKATAGFLALWLTIWTFGVYYLLKSAITMWATRRWAMAIFLTLFSLPFVAGEIAAIYFLSEVMEGAAVVVFIAIGLVNALFHQLMKAPTLLGRKIMDQLEGFKLYLSVAEKDRLNLANPPKETPELFEKYLPYALALDVEQKWSERFASVLAAAQAGDGGTYHPMWYHGSSWSRLGATGFANNLGSSFNTAISSSSTAPGSSSGSGGGGFSGGGGGGGGGGGW